MSLRALASPAVNATLMLLTLVLATAEVRSQAIESDPALFNGGNDGGKIII